VASPGACITPSSVRNVETVSLLTFVLPLSVASG
jgi:hypothetical protein